MAVAALLSVAVTAPPAAAQTTDDRAAVDDGEAGRVTKEIETRVAELIVQTLPPDAEVRIDGRVAGRTPLTVVLEPGPHEVWVRAVGYSDESRQVVIVGQRTRTLELVLKPKELVPTVSAGNPEATSLRPWMWLGVAAAGAGIALGTTFSVLASDSKDREAALRETPLPDPDAVRDLRDEARARSTVATAAFVGAGIGAAAALAFWWLEPDLPDTSNDRRPVVSWATNGRGLFLKTRF